MIFFDHSNSSDATAARALSASTIAFTICFAVWTIFSIIGVRIKAELDLTDTEFGLLVGMPILTGSLVRLVLGIWTDRFGGRKVRLTLRPWIYAPIRPIRRPITARGDGPP